MKTSWSAIAREQADKAHKTEVPTGHTLAQMRSLVAAGKDIFA